MQQPLTKRILEHLAECGISMIDAFFPANYPETRLGRALLGLEKSCTHNFSLSEKDSLSSILSRLRQEGLVTRTGPKKKSAWRITRQGKMRIREQSRRLARYNLPQDDGKIRLITFDIPECDRKKRNWLRTQLVACHFKLLQKSVWIGTRPLPGEVLEKLNRLHLLSCVHIVSLDKRGTLPRGVELE